jgi:hypothetical protein
LQKGKRLGVPERPQVPRSGAGYAAFWGRGSISSFQLGKIRHLSRGEDGEDGTIKLRGPDNPTGDAFQLRCAVIVWRRRELVV